MKLSVIYVEGKEIKDEKREIFEQFKEDVFKTCFIWLTIIKMQRI